VPLDDDLFDLLDACRRLHEQTGGAFDPTVGPLMAAWRLQADAGGDAPASVEDARRVVGMDKVVLDRRERTVRFAEPGVSLDLGGVAKGDALDGAAAILRDLGVASALLHAGTSTVVAIGEPPAEGREPSVATPADVPRGWRIAIGAEPGAPTVALRDAALSVSGPHGRTVEHESGTVGHVLDPRTGRSVQAASLAAVVTRSARDADAWSTALLVAAGQPDGPRPPGTCAVRNADPPAWHVRGDYPELFLFHGAQAQQETP
jgi:thiamine biosynthesis lipoprotein